MSTTPWKMGNILFQMVAGATFGDLVKRETQVEQIQKRSIS